MKNKSIDSRWWLSSAMVAILVFAITNLLSFQTANAVQSAPRSSVSVYITTTNTSTAYSQGCTQGTSDARKPTQSSEVILDFGTISADGTGTIIFNSSGSYITFAQLNSYAENYAYGYYVCTGSVTSSILNLAIGTNDSHYYVNSTGGNIWATDAVAPVKSWVAANLGQVTVLGANDIEPAWPSSIPAEAIAWVQAYSKANVAALLDYGSADGCPTATYNNSGTCRNGWTQDNLYFIAWGNTYSFSLPEIYVPDQSLQWKMISKYAAIYKTGKIYYDGPLTEYGSGGTYTSTQAWNQFWTDLNASTYTAISLQYRSDI